MFSKYDLTKVQREFAERVIKEKELSDYSEYIIELIRRLRIVFASMILTTLLILFIPERFLDREFTLAGYKPAIYRVLAQIYIHSVSVMIEVDNVDIVISSPMSVITYGVQFALMISFIINLPLLLVQIYRYVAPALYRREREVFKNSLIALAALFLMGCAIAYFVVVPVTLNVLNVVTAPLIDYGNESNLGLLYNFETILNIVTWTVFSSGLLYMVPGVIYILVVLEILDVEYLINNRKSVIMAILTLAAIITPDPTMVSMLVISGPLIVVYEIIIQVGYSNSRSRTQFQWRRY